MFESIKRWFAASELDGYDELITLIQVAQDKNEVNLRLRQVLELPLQQRTIELNIWVENCVKKGAPTDFTDAIRLLLQPQFAAKALQALDSLE